MMLQGVQSATALGQKGWAQLSGKGDKYLLPTVTGDST